MSRFFGHPIVASSAALVVLAGTTAATAQLNQQLTASSGSQAAGAPSGVRISQLNAPAITANGQMVYLAGLTGVGANSANGNAIFATNLNTNTTRMLARQGSRPAGMAAGITLSALGTPAINAAGTALYTATIAGTGVTSLNNKILMVSDATSTRVLARSGQDAPGMNTGIKISDIQLPMIAPSGHIAYQVTFSGSGMWNGTNRGVYIVNPGAGSAPSLAFRQSGQVSGMPSGVTWASFSAPTMTPSGQLLMLGFMQGGSVSAANDAVIWNSGGQILARKGDGVPGTSLTFSSFSSPTVSGSNVGFMAMLTDPESSQNKGGVFLASGGSIQTLARSGQTNSSLDTNTSWLFFGQPAMAAGGKVAFLATLTGSAVAPGASDVSLWSGDSSGVAQIARTGGAVPSCPGVQFDTIDQPSIAASGHVVFTARLRGSGVTSTNDSGLFAYHADTGLMLVSRTGRAMMAGTASRTPVELQTVIGGDGRATCMTETGSLVYLLRTSTGAMAVRTTLPRSLADIADASGRGADGVVNQRDLTAFMTAFAAGSQLADVTGASNATRDGQVTQADMQAFMNAYNTTTVSSGR